MGLVYQKNKPETGTLNTGKIMEFNIEQAGETGTLKLDGELTIQNVAALKVTLRDALDKVSLCKLDLYTVTSIDLAAIQLLHSAFKSAESMGKSLELIEVENVIFKKGVKSAGYSWEKWLCSGQV